MSDKLDIEDLFRHVFQRGSLHVEPEEHPDDRGARIRRSSHEFYMGQVTNGVVLVGLIAAGVFAAFLVVDENESVSSWARTIFAAIVAGGVSFFTGREVGRRR
jgi:hypothetical protein